MDEAGGNSPKVALVSRGDPGRLSAIAAALAGGGFTPEPCVYDEARAREVRAQLLACDAALVWVNPVQDGARRDDLDALLSEVARAGVLVSGRPDVIAKLGVKAVLWTTRELGWSGDARFYAGPASFMAEFPVSVALGPRVLKPNRGNGGRGIWKVSGAGRGKVEIQEAAGSAAPRVVPLAAFIEARLAEFAGAGGFVDQAFQPRLLEGMIRCYMSGARLAGFGHQLVRALAPPRAGPAQSRLYSGPDDPRFQDLRAKMEREWTPAMVRILEIAPADLPVIWDADFLLGPPTPTGADSHVLCEINASSVFPMPDQGPAAIVGALRAQLAKRAAAAPS